MNDFLSAFCRMERRRSRSRRAVTRKNTHANNSPTLYTHVAGLIMVAHLKRDEAMEENSVVQDHMWTRICVRDEGDERELSL